MNEFTGTLMDAPAHYYLLNTDLLHSALVNKVFSIPVLAERKYSFTIAMVCLFNLALMECADSFFKDERWKKGLFCVFADLVLFYSYSISGVSHYFAYRTYEGKSIISYFYMTVIFMFCLTFYKKGKKEWAGLGLLLSTMSGIAFSNSGLFLVPAAIFCMMAPYICQQVFVKRTGRDIVWLTGILLPSVFWIFLHEIL
jgi:hypothetical protein